MLLVVYLITCVLLFSIGLVGLLTSTNNLILTIMSLELVLLSLNMLLYMCTIYLDNVIGVIFIFFILTVSASETAIGLAFIVSYYKYLKIL